MKVSNLLISLALMICTGLGARDKFNFNSDWLLKVGDFPTAYKTSFNDKDWQKVTLPHAFNEDEAFKVSIHDHTGTVVWYRKHFILPKEARGQKVFIEFEGARQAAEVWINGVNIGLHENGVMAFGFDLTPYVKPGKNVIAVRVDNDWRYRERGTDTGYQWNHGSFNANYGGLPKNVWLHVTGKLYQTLPLYSNLKTTGVYIYASDMRVKARTAVINAESEVRNETGKTQKAEYQVSIYDRDGSFIKSWGSETVEIPAGETVTLKASSPLENIHFWSWGYGYLYDVKTALVVDGKVVDEVNTRTGFRKTRFAEGKIWLNDRVLQMKGFAQRTSNEWPALGMSVPAWLSDYSNALMVEDNANLVRWMHITPWKQDVESCDRVGLIQAMPAGDSEKDRQGRQWEHRVELMRDAIIYNRNNPSVIFYECGNESISREHMLEMKAIRDEYDFYGGRAIGSREMLDIREAEWGGEMLYVNKSAHHPFWATEYCRNEAHRKYWDEYSYPYHKEGEGYNAEMVKKKQDASDYNQNQDRFLVEHVRRWYDFYRERAGSGPRISSGGVKIIFSDSNTHNRSEFNYRTSGVTDPLRIPKDTYFAHQVMWDGWVDIENPRIFIAGHWNYEPNTMKPVYVVSNTETVKLFLNGKELKDCRQQYDFLFTFRNVVFEEGKLEAVGYNDGKEVARYSLETVGKPVAIKLSKIENPSGWKADGADVALVQIEVVDAQGRRCPLANDMIHYELDGPVEWRGGIAQGPDNYILAKDFPVECGVNRAILRSTTTAGKVTLTASAEGLEGASITLETIPFETKGGLSAYIPGDYLPGRLDRGETPQTPSYTDKAVDVEIVGVIAGSNQDRAAASFDDNELSEWTNDGKLSTAWITYKFGRMAQVDELCMKLTGWRLRGYPIEVYAGDELLWTGITPRSLGYVHLPLKPVMTREITIRLIGAAQEKDAFGGIVELVAPAAGELDLYKAKGGKEQRNELRIVEVEFKENLLQDKDKSFVPEPEWVKMAMKYDPVSGPGKPVTNDGKGGWISGMKGAFYNGDNPRPEYILDSLICDGSAVERGLVPPIVPAMELHLRDGVITLGEDGNYYLCGSNGDNIWAYNKGIELWKSADLHNWDYLGVVYDFDDAKEYWVSTWNKKEPRTTRAVWAPEIHYIKGNYYICFGMCRGGITIIKSTTGKPEGPYVNAFNFEGPITDGIDATLFEDEDGSVYYSWSGGQKIVKLRDDLSGFAEPFHTIEFEADTDPTHHNVKCSAKGNMNHVGHEGVTIFKRNGKYYLGAADEFEDRYSMCVAVADNIYGPYKMRHEAVPCGGGTGFFQDKEGKWWCSYFGNDYQSAWREKVGFVRVEFNSKGLIYPALEQPFVQEKDKASWEQKWQKVWAPMAAE